MKTNQDQLLSNINNNKDKTTEEKKDFLPFPHDLHGDYPMTQQKHFVKSEVLESEKTNANIKT